MSDIVPPKKPTERVREIDLLRFLAALAVVFFHYSFRGYIAQRTVMPYPLLAPVAKYGLYGVELFFLISGFVILMTASSGDARKFIVSRVVRLYPAFWACCTITFLAIIFFGRGHFTASLRQYLVNMTMLNEFLNVTSIDGVYWSLAVEMRFYALVAVLLVIKKIHRAELFLILWLAATIVLEAFPIDRLQTLLITNYSPYFIAGAISFLVWSQGMSFARIGAYLASWLMALHGSLKGFEGFEKQYHTPLSRPAVLVLLSIFFAILWLVSIRKTGFLGKSNWAALGALTYPLYLIHENVGFMIFNIGYPALNPHLLLWGTVLAMIGLAFFINTAVEARFSPYLKNWLNAVTTGRSLRG